MAEDEAAGAGARGALETLKHKVGPLPLGVWLIAGLVIYYVVAKRRKGSGTGQQTDPAGNVGTIDPQTGYVYGSSQDASALGGQNAGNPSASGSDSDSTVGGQYTTNNAWARAAINFLVGVGIDPTEANSAIEQYISSQQLTPQQQADVNLAIQSLGAPPDPPQPGGSPTPIVHPPSPGPVYAANPPTGVAVSGVTGSTITVKWNRSTNATGYTVTATASGKPPATTTVTGTDASGTVSGLSPNTLYTVKVQATPARPGDGSATTSTTTSNQIQGGNPPSSGKPPAPVGTPAPAPKTTTVTVVKFQGNPPPWNSTLSGIAAHYHTTVAAIMKLNPSIKDASLIHAGDQIKVPTP